MPACSLRALRPLPPRLPLLQPLLCEEPIAGGVSADAPRCAGGAASVSAAHVVVGSSQAEVAKRLVKSALPTTLLASALRALLKGGAARVWTDVSLPVFHTLLTALGASGGSLPTDVLGRLVASIDDASQPGAGVHRAALAGLGPGSVGGGSGAPPLTASLKFSTLIFALVTKFAAQLRGAAGAAHIATLESVLLRCSSMMTKAALRKLSALKAG